MAPVHERSRTANPGTERRFGGCEGAGVRERTAGYRVSLLWPRKALKPTVAKCRTLDPPGIPDLCVRSGCGMCPVGSVCTDSAPGKERPRWEVEAAFLRGHPCPWERTSTSQNRQVTTLPGTRGGSRSAAQGPPRPVQCRAPGSGSPSGHRGGQSDLRPEIRSQGTVGGGSGGPQSGVCRPSGAPWMDPGGGQKERTSFLR